jgi:hypothetical protein
MVAKLKPPYVDRLNPSYSVNADKKKQTAEAFEALNLLARQYGGAITSPPGRFVRIECPKGSPLPAKLTELGFNLVERGETMRVIGAQPLAPKIERETRTTPSPFSVMCIYETTLGK